MTRYFTHFARICMLIAGILMAVQALASAQPTRILVCGFSDLQTVPVGGDIVQDPAGNSHIQQLVQTGDFKLVESDCGDFAIQGTQLLVLNGVLDKTGSGPIAGSFTVKDDAETVIMTVIQSFRTALIVGCPGSDSWLSGDRVLPLNTHCQEIPPRPVLVQGSQSPGVLQRECRRLGC